MARAAQEGSRLGYFAALYRNVTDEAARPGRLAEQLAPLMPAEQQPVLRRRHDATTALAFVVRHPGMLVSAANFIIRLSEPSNVSRILTMLA